MLLKGVEGTLLIHLKERLPVVLFCPFWSLVLVSVGFLKSYILTKFIILIFVFFYIHFLSCSFFVCVHKVFFFLSLLEGSLDSFPLT